MKHSSFACPFHACRTNLLMKPGKFRQHSSKYLKDHSCNMENFCQTKTTLLKCLIWLFWHIYLLSNSSKRPENSTADIWAYSQSVRTRNKLLTHIRGLFVFSGDDLLTEECITFYAWTIQFIFFPQYFNVLTKVQLKILWKPLYFS